MTWNYRILRHTDGVFALHEVFYDDNYLAVACNEQAIVFGDTEEEVRRALTQMLADALEPAEPLSYEDF